MSTRIQVRGISKSFNLDGKTLPVLSYISFDINGGEIVSIVGKSGSGKTTLLNIIAGLEKPDSGSVSVSGKIGYVPQKDLLLPWRTLMRNILLPIEIKKKVGNEDISKAGKLVKEIGLDGFEKAFPHEISGGMKQKVSLVRAMIQDPDIILFDEPFSAIDFDSRLRLETDRFKIKNSGKIGIFSHIISKKPSPWVTR